MSDIVKREKKYKCLIRWETNSGEFSQLESKNHNSEEAAIHCAEFAAKEFGFSKPKWWQIWRLHTYEVITSSYWQEMPEADF